MKDFYRDVAMMESRTDDLTKRIQECEIEILQQIDHVCRKYNLRYFAIGGTALGAVRHGGFIPWDDDIDIGMPRDDYNKLLKVLQKELPQEYHVQMFKSEKGSPFYFTKVRKDNTLFVEYYLKDYDMHQGVFVDIFPFDNVPQNQLLEKIHYRIGWFLYQLYLAKSLKTVCSSRFGNRKNKKKRVIRKALHYLLVLVPKAWLFYALDWWVQLFNGKETEEIAHIVRRRLRVKVKDLYPIRYLQFDGMEIAVPNDYDAYLKGQFGEYDILPPPEKRYGHLPYLVELDVDRENTYGYRVHGRCV